MHLLLAPAPNILPASAAADVAAAAAAAAAKTTRNKIVYITVRPNKTCASHDLTSSVQYRLRLSHICNSGPSAAHGHLPTANTAERTEIKDRKMTVYRHRS